jgi:hypothetical protein
MKIKLRRDPLHLAYQHYVYVEVLGDALEQCLGSSRSPKIDLSKGFHPM